MYVQVRTDNHIENSDELNESIRAEVEAALEPQFSDRLQRVEVYLQDMNSHKGGVDIRCSMEARLAGHPVIAVAERAAALDGAVNGAVEKLARTIERTLGRIEDKDGRVSMSGNET